MGFGENQIVKKCVKRADNHNEFGECRGVLHGGTTFVPQNANEA